MAAISSARMPNIPTLQVPFTFRSCLLPSWALPAFAWDPPEIRSPAPLVALEMLMPVYRQTFRVHNHIDSQTPSVLKPAAGIDPRSKKIGLSGESLLTAVVLNGQSWQKIQLSRSSNKPGFHNVAVRILLSV
ncbi:hypothetical protein ZWY2020_009532 [Hordeum vulgare]|nr:hypothetical protein ZWY2020_009532 [Hordeum vulgare]